MVMALFGHTTINSCFGKKAYSKHWIIVNISTCSVFVEEWRRGLLDCLFDIAGSLPSMGGANIQGSLVIKGGGWCPSAIYNIFMWLEDTLFE